MLDSIVNESRENAINCVFCNSNILIAAKPLKLDKNLKKLATLLRVHFICGDMAE
jgi:hypothetical protein